MKKNAILTCALTLCAFSNLPADPPAGKNWKLVWQDDFNYENHELDKEWLSQNGNSVHIACSRWRENVDVKDGLLVITNRKEERGGQDWTSGSIWSKKLFKYGYFECRYKYAKHPTTNNSFWLMPRYWQRANITEGKVFEIDINEGWYPDIIRTNTHNWTDIYKDENGKWRTDQEHKVFCLSPKSGSPDKSFEFEKPIKATKLRLSSKNLKHFHLRSLRAWEPSFEGYPDVKLPKVTSAYSHLTDHARRAKISAHSPLNPEHPQKTPDKALDGDMKNSWITGSVGEKFIELDFGEEKEIGCVQFLTGWPQKVENDNETGYVDYIYNYKVEYFDGKKWQTIADVENDRTIAIDLSEDFHTYALEWDENELVFYFDDKEIRRIKNKFSHWETPVWISLAILKGLGERDDSLDGTQMIVDWVKVWQADGTKATWRDKTPEETKP